MSDDETRVLFADEPAPAEAPPRLGVQCIGETFFGEGSADASAETSTSPPSEEIVFERSPRVRKRLLVLGGVGGATAGLALAAGLWSGALAPQSREALQAAPPPLLPPTTPDQEREPAGTVHEEASDAVPSEVAARGARGLARGDCPAALDAYKSIAARDEVFAILATRLALVCSAAEGKP